MDSMIKETNENLKSIINTMKSTLDSSIETLDNIQMQMDKKVEEAKKYKEEVDLCKNKITKLETINSDLEKSLKELNDKYSKMNLLSVIDAGNKEIKSKINYNLNEIGKLKEHIADLTNKARTIKDLLINLKKDKTIKEERLENISTCYSYYSERIEDIIEYAVKHSDNLIDYKNDFVPINVEEPTYDYNQEIENTMVFDEIASIDEDDDFKEEVSNEENNVQEDENYNNFSGFDNIIDIDNEKTNENIVDFNEESEIEKSNDNEESNTIYNMDFNKEELTDNNDELDKEDNLDINISNNELDKKSNEDETISNTKDDDIEISKSDNNKIDTFDTIKSTENNIDFNNNFTDLNLNNKTNIFNPTESNYTNKTNIEDDGQDRLNKINDLFSSINSNNEENNVNENKADTIESKIDNVYSNVFGQNIEEPFNEVKKEPTLTDIFGNPIKEDNLNVSTNNINIEEMLTKNGIDFKKFKEDEQTYLKEIYNENKFQSIINTLNKYNINLDNIYNACNIFGEITDIELDNILSKLINAGQSIESIGLILEKLPRIKKYDLDTTINSYGDYIKNIDLTELIMKAKELYDGGKN